ncbi:MAG: sulfate ABC transporter permease subunit CysW [Deltaproteobacteria bacterium]|jgi:sulfate transport system permease protein|nr:sulfate ABC transporter permease subunit CysW [Deltaproteobacteria bacterium]
MHNKNNLWLPRLLIALSFAFVLLMLAAPLSVVLAEAFSSGWELYLKAVTDHYALRAAQLTVIATLSSVLLNVAFGLTAAWAVTRFSFRGKGLLTTLIDIPFAVSPVIAGLVFILLFGRLSPLHSFLDAYNLRIVFAVPGIVLVTIFVTLPFVAREIIPVLEARGTDEEQAAALMGAGFFRIFRRITFPHIRWALLYSLILCAARAMGEFGAVSVVSGHLRGKTNTLPLHVEILYSEYQFTAAFAVSSVLAAAAIAILVARNIVELAARKEKKSNVR